MIRIEQSVISSASVQEMWDVLTHHEDLPRWFKPVRKVHLDPPGHDERDGLGAVRHMHAVGPTIVEEIVEWAPPRRYAYRLLRGAPIRDHLGEVTVEATPLGTRATWAIRFRPVIPGSGLVLRHLMNHVAKALLKGAAKYAEAPS